ncbi:DUF3575 domain-containing protein [Polaribacter sp.]|uniref:DUF3575 domain-containing protein n=1 Tax=Polaribacter sp. TaxID=1920175 RepID=UPI0025CD6774|nr:DUF3575 domain-containing protein [Polaribacter sp.]
MFLCFLVFNSTSAQTNAIKVNPLGLAFGVANAGYEFTTSDSQTATISGIYYGVPGIKGFGVGAEYRFYFSTKEALKGWHAGPSVGYFSLEDDFNTSASVFSIGGEAGHQWVWDSGFLVDVFAGLGFVTGGDTLSGLNTTSAAIGVSIGYAW